MLGESRSVGGGVGYPRALAERQSAGRCVVAVMIGVGWHSQNNKGQMTDGTGVSDRVMIARRVVS